MIFRRPSIMSFTERRRRQLAMKWDRLDRLETRNAITEPISVTGLASLTLRGCAGKASLEAEMDPIFQRLGLDQHVLESTVSKLFEPGTRISNRLGRPPERFDADRTRSDTNAGGAPRHPTRQLVV